MLNLPFFNQKNKEQQNKFLAININADKVDCLAFYSDSETLKVIGAATQKLTTGAVRAGVIIEKDEVAESISVAISNATEQIGLDITNVLFGLTADVSVENIVTAKVKRAVRTPITKKELAGDMSKLEEAAYNQAVSAYAESTGNLEVGLEAVTNNVVYYKLDGQKVSYLENNIGQGFEIAIYNAFSTDFHVKNLQYIAKKLKLKITALSSNNFSMTKLIELSELERNDYILVEIGYDYTNIGIVFGGAVVTNKVFHIGTKHFIEEISQIMGITFEEAEKLLLNHTQGRLTKSESIVVQDCLEEVLEIWLRGLELTFHEFSGVKTFAPTIYLYGTGTHIPEITEIMSNEPWPKAIPFKSPPTIKVLDIKDFPKITDTTGKITAGLYLETVALGSIYEGLIQ